MTLRLCGKWILDTNTEVTHHQKKLPDMALARGRNQLMLKTTAEISIYTYFRHEENSQSCESS